MGSQLTTRNRYRRWMPVLCFLLALLCVGGALLGFWQEWPVKELVVVRDVSASMWLDPGERDSNYQEYLEVLKPQRVVDVVAAGEAYVIHDSTKRLPVPVSPEQLQPRQTNIEKALRVAAGIKSPGLHKRCVLVFTDGRENRGDAGGFMQENRKYLQVNFVPRGNSPVPDARILDLLVPDKILPGKEFVVRAYCSSSPAAMAEVKIYLAGKEVSRRRVQLSPQPLPVDFKLKLDNSGVGEIKAEVSLEGDRVIQNNLCTALAVVGKQGKVLWIGSSPAAGLNERFDIDTAGNLSAGEITNYSLLVITGEGLQGVVWNPNILREYLNAGGRAILVYTPDFLRAAINSRELLELLPTKPEDNVLTATVFLLDTSGSMGESGDTGSSKLALSVRALNYVLSSLDSSQRAAVVAFSLQPQLVVPMSKSPFSTYSTKLMSMQASGGTDIFKALQEGVTLLHATSALQRQIILLTDGAAKEKGAELEGKLRAARQSLDEKHIRLDIVATGKDADMDLLKSLADGLGGVTQAADELTVLPAVLEGKLNDFADNGLLSENLHMTNIVAPYSTLLSKGLTVNMALQSGPLKTAPGYSTLLAGDNGEIFLASGNYGLGSVLCLSGDPQDMWGLGSKTLPFWRQILQENISPLREGDLQAFSAGSAIEVLWKPFQTVSGGWVASLEPEDGAGEISDSSQTNHNGDTGVHSEVKLHPLAGGVWSCTFPLPLTGRFVLRVYDEKARVVAVRPLLVDNRTEYLQLGVDGVSLQRLAYTGGGRVLYSPQQVAGWDNVPVAGNAGRLPQALLWGAMFFLAAGLLLRGLLP